MNSSQEAGYYDRYWQPNVAWSPSAGELNALELSLISSSAKPGHICLDYGCGDGRRYGVALQNMGYSYIGFDVSPEAVRMAQDLGLRAELLSNDGNTSLESDSCDIAICFEVFEHLLEPETALKEILRVLKPHGVLIASVPNAAHWFARVEFSVTGFWLPGGRPGTSRKTPWNDPHIRFFSPDVLRRFIRTYGFSSVKIIPNEFSLAALPYIYKHKGLANLANRISTPIGWISKLSPGLFASRIFAMAVK